GPAAAPQLSEMPQPEHGASRGAPSTAEPEEEPARRTPRSQFIHERVRRDEFGRQAAIGRFRQAMAAVSDAYDEAVVRGFDVACVPKAKLFGRGKGPRLLGRFVPCVDGEAVADAWTQAGRWCGPSNEDVCVFLIGSAVAPPRELADAIAKQRRKPAAGRVTLIPLDARDWRAHLPTDAPELAKNLVARLRDGA